MANQNLSQFGEKLFVADADHTFIWDTAASISKRVSRNSWLNSGTLTSDAPVTISQTWNAVGQTFKALVVNAAGSSDANSASGSKLLELQVGGAPVFSVSKGGGLRIPIGQFLSGYGIGWVNSGFYATNNSNIFGVSNNQAIVEFKPEGFQISSALSVSWGSPGSPSDTILLRDGAANTLALRNGDVGQTFNIYGTYTGAGANYARLGIYCAQNGNTTIATQANGTGVAGAFIFSPSNTERMRITTAGNVGIGTTAPSEKLHVLGGKVLFGDATDVTGTAGNGDLTLRAYRSPQIHISANNSSGVFYGLNIELNNSIYAGLLLNLSSGEVKIGALAATYFPTFYSNNVERMRIDTTGNVGIGTTSPTSKLHVVGDELITGNSSLNNGLFNTNTTRVAGLIPFQLGTSSYLGFTQTYNPADGAVDTILLRDGEADHLAMRRSTNGQKFSVYGTYPGAAWERFTITAPTSGNVLLGTYKGTGGVARGLELQADGTTRMLITAAGAIIQRPLASVTPPDNGDLVVEATSNTTLTFKLKGTDGTVRTGTITLA